MIRLEPVQLQHVYKIGGDDGYEFTVYCSKDNEFGAWSASVSITTWGTKTAEGAIENLIPALKNLLSKLEAS